MRTSKKLLSAIVSLALIITLITPASVVNAATQTKSASQQYVEAMGSGWNLGNTFDGFDTGGDRGEESWGNPKVTKELLHTIKEAGFDSIRIPLTTTMRIGDSSTNYKLDDTFMDRYEEVVSWALDEGFYVMINVHHDSWDWLSNWDGKTSSEEYLKYVSIWNQLSNRF